MDIREYLKTNRIFLDGGTGTLLQNAGLKPANCPNAGIYLMPKPWFPFIRLISTQAAT